MLTTIALKWRLSGFKRLTFRRHPSELHSSGPEERRHPDADFRTAPPGCGSTPPPWSRRCSGLSRSWATSSCGSGRSGARDRPGRRSADSQSAARRGRACVLCWSCQCGCSSVGRARAFQARCRGFEPRRPLRRRFTCARGGIGRRTGFRSRRPVRGMEVRVLSRASSPRYYLTEQQGVVVVRRRRPGSKHLTTTHTCACGGTGRRAAFRSPWGKLRGGSSPLTRTPRGPAWPSARAGVAQLVEHLLPKQKATGSSPVARSCTTASPSPAPAAGRCACSSVG